MMLNSACSRKLVRLLCHKPSPLTALSVKHLCRKPREIQNRIHKQCHECSCRMFSSTADDGSNDDDKIRNDPLVKEWMNEITQDFKRDQSTDITDDKDGPHNIKDDPETKNTLKETAKDFGVNEMFKDDGTAHKTENINTTEDRKVDVDREMQRYNIEEFFDPDVVNQDTDEQIVERVLPFSLARGETGVFDIEDMVALLRDENAQDICVIRVPVDMDYVDYMVLANGRSLRHLKAMAQFIKWSFKQKRDDKDPKSCKIEGQDASDWLALDLGNMAVHLFLRQTRQKYDLETLWTVGPKFDDLLKEKEDPYKLSGFEGFDIFSPAVNTVEIPTNVNELDYQEQIIQQKNSEQYDKKPLENVAGWHAAPPKH